jgi:hypothetical protein
MNNEHKTTIQKILKAVGQKVKFHYTEKSDKLGILKDRVIIPSELNPNGVSYWDVVDLIEFPGEAEPEWIRIGYYQELGGRLLWASRATITEPIEIWKKILVTTAREKPWFKKLLDDVHKEIG